MFVYSLCTCFLILAQVSPQIPRTTGDATVNESHFDYFAEEDCLLVPHAGQLPNESETQIRKSIAQNLIEDGETLQLGIKLIL
jgi:hypothetical protein